MNMPFIKDNFTDNEDTTELHTLLCYFIQVYFVFVVFAISSIINDIVEPRQRDVPLYTLL